MASNLSDQQRYFLQTYTPLAQDIAGQTGLDPSVVLGQMAQETGWGMKVPGNNLFGLSPGGKVASYPTAEAGAQAYVDLIHSRYSNASAATTPDAQAQAIAAGGYGPAGDPTYGTKVAQLATTIRGGGPGAAMSDADLNAALTGAAPVASTSTPTGAPAGPDASAGPASGMADADLDRALLGTPGGPAAASSPPVSQFQSVAPHPAPDGSGAMTNLSDADYATFRAQVAADRGRAASPPPAQPATVPTAPAPVVDVSGARPTAAVPGASGVFEAPGTTVEYDAATGAPFYRTASGDVAPTSEETATGAGIVRGARDLIDPVATWMAGTLSPYVGGPSGANVAAGNTAARTAFDQTYGGNPLATAGRVAGQIATTAPVMAVANPLLAGAGGIVAGAASRLVPAVGNALQFAGDVVGGTAGGGGFGGNLLQAGSRATQGAVLGGETAALTSGQSDQPIGQQIARGAETGAAFGAGVPMVAQAARGVTNALTGGAATISPEVAQLAALARDRYGIQLKAPQLGMSSTLAYTNNALKMLPGSGAGAENAAVQSQFNRAVAQTFGENATKITPDVLSRAQARIGAVMDHVENGTPITFDNDFVDDISRIESNARVSLPDSEFGVVRRQLDNVLRNLQTGDTITGTTYGNLIHRGSPLDAALNSSDSNIRNYAGQIREALRDSLTRSLPVEDAAAYQNARTQYKNLKTVQPLTLRADTTGGPAPSTGDISPAALRAAVNRSFGEGVAQAPPGRVPLNDLARIGQMLKEPPTSGTAERSSILYAGAKAAELAGAAAAGHYAGLLPAAASIGAGVAGGRAIGAYLRSNYLANRLIASGLRGPTSINPLFGQLQTYTAPLGVIGTNPLQTIPAAAPGR